MTTKNKSIAEVVPQFRINQQKGSALHVCGACGAQIEQPDPRTEKLIIPAWDMEEIEQGWQNIGHAKLCGEIQISTARRRMQAHDDAERLRTDKIQNTIEAMQVSDRGSAS